MSEQTRPPSRSLVWTVWALAAFVWLAGHIAHCLGLTINLTASMPFWIWRFQLPTEPLQRGQVVLFCPPDNAALRAARVRGYLGYGPCPGGYDRLLKQVMAIGGDTVGVNDAGLTVNGEPVPGTARLPADAGGRPIAAIPPGTAVLPAGLFWAGSNYNPRSFDSRYFGPVSAASVLGVARH